MRNYMPLLMTTFLLAGCASQPTATAPATTPSPWSITLAIAAFLAFAALAGLWVASEDSVTVNRRFTAPDGMKPRTATKPRRQPPAHTANADTETAFARHIADNPGPTTTRR